MPAERIERLEPQAARTSTTKLNLAQFDRRPGEVLLRARCAGSQHDQRQDRAAWSKRARWSCSESGPGASRGSSRASAPGSGAFCRGAFAATSMSTPSSCPGPRSSRSSAHVPTSRLRLRSRRLARLHPAQIADLVEAASHDEGEEIMQAVGAGQGARGRRVRGARRRAPGRVSARAIRRGGRRGAGADGERRRRRSAARDRAGPPDPGAEPAACLKAAEDQAAARLQPLDRGRADEPGLRVGAGRRDRRSGTGACP